MMQKKKFIFGAAAVLALLVAVNSTLAFFTDTDAKDNTFTSGNVKIQLLEQERNPENPNGPLQDFTQGKKLIPYTGKYDEIQRLDKNYVDKIVNVKNTGSEPAYVAVWTAIPAPAFDIIFADMNIHDDQWKLIAPMAPTAPRQQVTINGELYDVAVSVYQEILQPGKTTQFPAMYGLLMNPLVDTNDQGQYTLDDQVINYDMSKFCIPVYAGAVQAQGFDSPEEAFTAAGMNLPKDWIPYTAPKA